MAHSLSAKKRVRQNLSHRLRNRRRTKALSAVIKDFLTAVHDGKAEAIKAQLPKVYQLIDQNAASGTIHKNAAARYKSRLTARINAAKAKPAA